MLAGGGVTAGMLLKGGGKPAYTPAVQIPGVKITEASFVERGTVLFETDGVLTVRELADAYRDARAELERAKPPGATLDVLNVVTAIPRDALCSGGIARAASASCAPTDVATTAMGGKKHVLLISNDRARLAETMRRGLAAAVCDFQPLYANDRAVLDATCKLRE